jgi:hypothetical protein
VCGKLDRYYLYWVQSYEIDLNTESNSLITTAFGDHCLECSKCVKGASVVEPEFICPGNSFTDVQVCVKRG